MSLRSIFKKHSVRSDDRWFAMMQQAALFRAVQ